MPKGSASKNQEEKVEDPTLVNLKMTMKEWVLYWKTKYERAHMMLVEQKRAAATILNQRDSAVRMLNELPAKDIMQLQNKAEKTARRDKKEFQVPKSLAAASAAQKALADKKAATRKTARKVTKRNKR